MQELLPLPPPEAPERVVRIEKNLNARQGALNAARRRSEANTKSPETILKDKRRKAEMRARLTTPEMLESVKRRYGLND